MTFAAMQLPGEVGERRIGQLGLGHFADHFPEALMKFIAGVKFNRRCVEQAVQRARPKLQQGAAQ